MRLKRTFIIFLFTFAFIGISLVGLLVPYFSLENSYRETLTNFSFNINEVLNSENEDNIIADTLYVRFNFKNLGIIKNYEKADSVDLMTLYFDDSF